MNKPKIVLFDLDCTLLSGSSKIHRQAYSFALKTVFGFLVDIHNRPIDGQIDSQILMEIALDYGVKKQFILRKMPELIKYTNTYFLNHEQAHTYKLLPGANKLVLNLQSREVLIGVLTGNTTEIGNWKLKTVGLNDNIKFGVFGDMALSRPLLAQLAWKKLSRIYKNLRQTDLLLIGDTPRDIDCARSIGSRVIAVTSGKFNHTQLKKADLIVDSLTEEEYIINFLLA